MRTHGAVLALVALLTGTSETAAQTLIADPISSVRLAGVVLDAAGSPVPEARVTVRSGGRAAVAVAGPEGRFVVEWAGPPDVGVEVEARGFARHTQTMALAMPPAALSIVLWRTAFADEVTVTASRHRERLGDTASSVVVLSSEEIAATAALAVDDALRQVPGFALFRRTGSRTANPTSQGVSLRGLAGSGASRAVVLDDGVSLNDPFGGWVYWGRVPRASLDRIEVLRGGASSLYGSGALAGAVQLLRRRAAGPRVDLEASYGSERTHQASLFAQADRKGWAARLGAESFATDGYIAVDERVRGPVDTPSDSRHLAVDLTLERSTSAASRFFVRGAYFEEQRRNGTPLQRNDTRLGDVAVGADAAVASGRLMVRGHAGHQRYDQSFSAIAADRRSERFSRDQTVPTDAGGLTAQWTRGLGSRQMVMTGVDGSDVKGRSDEMVFGATGVSPAVGAGHQRAFGVFAEDRLSLGPRLSVAAGVRLDHWRNFDARRSSGGTDTTLPDRSETAVSPRVSLLCRASDGLSLTSSAYGAFRAPTLNELYRTFRVGNVVTLANEDLKAERMRGGEAGLLAAFAAGAMSVRGTAFWMEVDDTVANVTLSVTPALVTRQRRNLGSIRSRGVEVEAEARPSRRLTLAAAGLFTEATVRSFPEDRTLEGLAIPQVPRYQASAQARYAMERFGLALQGRWTSGQFEDDQNRLELGAVWSLDAFAWVPLGRSLEAFAAVENATDARWEIGRTPARTLGPPRSVRGGIRLRLAPRTNP